MNQPSWVGQINSAIRSWCVAHLNFYRVHLLYFTFTPLIASAIFYASNGDYKYSYVDSLFVCVSAVCVCGLSPIPLSPATVWQQVLLLLLICGGSLTSVSLITILIRLKFFRDKFKEIVKTSPAARKRMHDVEARDQQHPRTFFHFLDPSNPHPQPAKAENDGAVKQDEEQEGSGKPIGRLNRHEPWDYSSRSLPGTPPPSGAATPKKQQNGGKKRKKLARLHPGMIRKVDDQSDIAQAIHRLASEQAEANEEEKPNADVDIVEAGAHIDPTQAQDPAAAESSAGASSRTADEANDKQEASSVRSNEQVFMESPPDSPGLASRDLPDQPPHRDSAKEMRRTRTGNTLGPRKFTTAHTVDFREDLPPSMRRRRRSTPYSATAGEAFPRSRTGNLSTTKHTGYGGFTNPVTAIAKMVGSNVEGIVRTHTLQPTTTMPQTSTTGRGLNVHRTGTYADQTGQDTKPAPYITFDAIVGRNSRFQALTDSQQEELGGVEYRALKLLWKIVLLYWLTFQCVALIMLGPYINIPHFDDRFQGTTVHPVWYTTFNIWSAFSNTGLSLLDSSMTGFNATYYYVLTLCVLILAGNTAFPIFLRLSIWVLSKIVPAGSRIQETSQFLLDHPRRSFLYLFPSYQTWFLVFVLVVLNCVDWFFFVVLDIGNSMLEAIPLRIRILDGFFQALAVRSAGFNIIDVSQTAPSLQVLYIIMMYIAVYPIALSIRSTNVYEERSMGLYEDDNEEQVEQEYARNRMTGSYIAYHARKQLAFDSWWLVFALWLICIVERDRIEDFQTDSWFNVFTVLFEITSGYGTVGLSLGSPETGTSLVGSFHTLSKLILVAVIIRGRHRGLPNAIDRAVLLPSDMQLVEGEGLTADEEPGRFASMSANNNTFGEGLARTISAATGRRPSRHSRARSTASSGLGRDPPAEPQSPESIAMEKLDRTVSAPGYERQSNLHVGFDTPQGGARTNSERPPIIGEESESSSHRSF